MQQSLFGLVIPISLVATLCFSLAQAKDPQPITQLKSMPTFITYSHGQKVFNVDKKGIEVFNAHCVACHNDGTTTDPDSTLAIGDKAKWRPKIAGGMENLYDHVINGYTTANGFAHPIAKGQFSNDAIKQSVNYMVAYSSDDNQNIIFYENGKAKNIPTVNVSNGKELYENTCKTCHEAGIAGAIKTGDKKVWAKRIKQGKAILYRHAIEGYDGKNGYMPAKGGSVNMSDEMVKQAVDYMIKLSK